MNFQEMMAKLQQDPKQFMKEMGVQVPDEILKDPRAMVMHLMQTGQVKQPIIQQIAPMIRSMGGLK